MTFYETFLSLCKAKNVRPSRAAEDCGINRSNVSNWKSNGYTPRGDALQRLADYFEVSVDYLLGNTKEETIESFVTQRQPLLCVARLEGANITPDEDEEITSLIEWFLDNRKRRKVR